MSTVIERLEEILDARDNTIAELKNKIEDFEYRDEWQWRQIRTLSEEENLDLPVPRLEIRHRAKSNYNTVIDYGLVYTHLLGNITFMPISSTKVSGIRSGELFIPHRDGAHMYNDMFELNLRGFIVEGSKSIELYLSDIALPQVLRDRMEKGK
jgi:hypothetical protein